MSSTYRQSLTAEDFGHLVRGGTLRVEFVVRAGFALGVHPTGAVELSLQDIGYDEMRRIISEAEGDGESRLRLVKDAGAA